MSVSSALHHVCVWTVAVTFCVCDGTLSRGRAFPPARVRHDAQIALDALTGPLSDAGPPAPDSPPPAAPAPDGPALPAPAAPDAAKPPAPAPDAAAPPDDAEPPVADTSWPSPDIDPGVPLRVVPGVVGFGTTTPAGRGGAILKVTNLNATGAGSLRDALEASGPRVIIFELSGTIVLSDAISIKNPYVTLAGQTAPSPGITLRGAGLTVKTHDVLIQHIRIRVGDASDGPSPTSRDALQILGNSSAGTRDVVVDHVSASWAIDENTSTWYDALQDVTFHACIISEALDDSLHPEGPHSKGLLVGDGAKRISIIGNLFAHNVDRNPFLKGGVTAVVVNNVFYNWGNSGATRLGSSDSMSVGPVSASVVGNLYIAGADTPSNTWAIRVRDVASGTTLYHLDNLVEGNASSNVSLFRNDESFDPLVKQPPVWVDSLVARPANVVESWVAKTAGARPADRDAVDLRIVSELGGRSGKVINSQDAVGGWPQLADNHRPLTPPANPHGDSDGDGYTNLEEWLHGHAAAVTGP